MPAWMTPLLRVLVSCPTRPCRSSTHTDAPRPASSAADGRPTTPAPTTTTSAVSMYGGFGLWALGLIRLSAKAQSPFLRYLTQQQSACYSYLFLRSNFLQMTNTVDVATLPLVE